MRATWHNRPWWQWWWWVHALLLLRNSVWYQSRVKLQQQSEVEGTELGTQGPWRGTQIQVQSHGLSTSHGNPTLRTTQGGWLTFHLVWETRKQWSQDSDATLRLFPLLPSKLPERQPCQHQLWVNLISRLPLTCLPHAETETGSLILAALGWISAILIKTNRASVCLFFLEGGRENVSIKLLKHTEAEASNSVYSQ